MLVLSKDEGSHVAFGKIIHENEKKGNKKKNSEYRRQDTGEYK